MQLGAAHPDVIRYCLPGFSTHLGTIIEAHIAAQPLAELHNVLDVCSPGLLGCIGVLLDLLLILSLHGTMQCSSSYKQIVPLKKHPKTA